MRVTHVFAPGVVTDPVEALRRVVYDGHALDACAQAIGVSHQTLSKFFNPDEEAQLSMRRGAAIEQFMGTDALAECFAARRGGLFVKLPAVGAASDAPAIAQFSDLLREFSEAAREFSATVGDGKVEQAEVDRFRKELRDVYMAGERAVEALQREVKK